MKTGFVFLMLAIALSVVCATGVMAAGPVGLAPMTGLDSQNTQVYSGSSTNEAYPAPMWSYAIQDGVFTTPLLDDDANVYVSTNNATTTFVALDTDGNLLWSLGNAPTDGQGCLGSYGEPGGTFWYVPWHKGADWTGGPGAICKVDVSDGSIIWTLDIVAIGGNEPTLYETRLVMDEAGGIYCHAKHGYIQKIVDNGASGSIVWQSYTGGTHGGGQVALSPDESVAYQVVNGSAIAELDKFRLYAINTTNGNLLWSAEYNGGPGSVPANGWIAGQPVVDDDGNIYAYFNRSDNTDGQGITKYDNTGAILWTRKIEGSDSIWAGSGPDVAFNLDQSRIYHHQRGYGSPRTYAIDTTTGYVQWTLTTVTDDPSGGYFLVGPTGLIYTSALFCGTGPRIAVEAFEDNGTTGAHAWNYTHTEGGGCYWGGCSMDNEGSLYSGFATWAAPPGGVFKLHPDGPPILIVAPETIDDLEEEIPIYGGVDAPAGFDPGCDGRGVGLEFVAKGAQAAITWSVVAGSLPPGLYLTSDGYLRGAPDDGSAGPHTFTVKADDGFTSDQKQYTVTVFNGDLRFGPGAPLGAVGTPYDGGLWIIGGTKPYTVIVTAGKADGGTGDGTLGNTGLTLTLSGADAGKITGTPAKVSSATVEVGITDGNLFWSRDVTIDVVDSRAWTTFQRTNRRVGTSTLPAPVSYPHNMGVYDENDTSTGRTFQYNSADTWTWTYEMLHTPMFAHIESDADSDGQDDGFLLGIYNRFYGFPHSYPPDTYGWALRLAAPYDVDPGGIYPDVLNFGGWLIQWEGQPGPDMDSGVLKLSQTAGKEHYATRYFYGYNANGPDGRLVAVDPNNGTTLWSTPGDAVNPAADCIKRGQLAINEDGDVVAWVGRWDYWYGSSTVDPPWTVEHNSSGKDNTYGIVRELAPDRGEVIWTAGEVNTPARAGQGPLMGGLSGNYRGPITLCKLADEGELVLAQRWDPNPYYPGTCFAVRADKPPSETIWTIGMGAGGSGTGWTWQASSARGCMVVDSTNNVYVTKSHTRANGLAEYHNPGIWCIDAAHAADNSDTYTWGLVEVTNSDYSIKWMSSLVDGDYYRIPASPCLSRDQRTLYTVAVAQSDAFDPGGHQVLKQQGVTSKLIALHTINGAIKWVKELQIDGLGGCQDDSIDRPALSPMADSDGKVLCTTDGDHRKWWDTPGTDHNPVDPAFDGLLRPMAWCFKDTGSDATLVWTRAVMRPQYLDWGGPGSYAITPNYRMVFSANVDPEWIVPGRLSGWGSMNAYYCTGVKLIHPDDIHITDVWFEKAGVLPVTQADVNVTFESQTGVSYDLEGADATDYAAA